MPSVLLFQFQIIISNLGKVYHKPYSLGTSIEIFVTSPLFEKNGQRHYYDRQRFFDEASQVNYFCNTLIDVLETLLQLSMFVSFFSLKCQLAKCIQNHRKLLS